MKRLPIVDGPNDAQYGVVAIDRDECNGCKMCTLICPSNIVEVFGAQREKRVRVKLGSADSRVLDAAA